MSYIFEWLVPDQILKVVFPTTFTDDVAQKFDEDMLAYLDKAPQPFHLIIDMRAVKHHPSMKTLANYQHINHPNLHRIVTIGMADNPIIRFMAGMMMRVIGFRTKDVASVEEAMAYLATVGPKE